MGSDQALDSTLKRVFCSVFDVTPDAVTDQTRRGELERWDSLGHIDLLEALRNEFQFEIPVDQALEMETVADIKRILRSLGSPRGRH
ncbi:MAG: hypothetical protein CHACPFDD_02854 [Phycisphaerae bacterium]|nr:hypothetical protein [Phycisphaerae bacterium]